MAPILFEDDDKAAGEALRTSVVAPAQRSGGAQAKATTKQTSHGGPVHSFTTLLRDLATVVKNRVQPKADSAMAFDKRSGKVVWKTGDELASYSSPVLATIAGRRWCFVLVRGGLLGLEPKSGKIDFHFHSSTIVL